MLNFEWEEKRTANGRAWTRKWKPVGTGGPPDPLVRRMAARMCGEREDKE